MLGFTPKNAIVYQFDLGRETTRQNAVSPADRAHPGACTWLGDNMNQRTYDDLSEAVIIAQVLVNGGKREAPLYILT